MLIIPAIDLKDGACVRLRQGRMEDSTVFSDDPVSMAAKWVEGGCRRLHLVDLNGAFEGQPVNGEVVTAIAKRYPNLPIQIGGGIRSLETIEHYVKAGVSYVIIGNERFTLRKAVEDTGKTLVGADIWNKYGRWPVYSKFFDNMGPIPHHMHQSEAQAKLIGQEGKPETEFYSGTSSLADRLPNGNTLITVSEPGRAIEVTREKEVVWEFYNPRRAGDNNEYIATLFQLERIAKDYCAGWLK